MPLLDDVSHRLRRGASHPTPRRSERGPSHYSDRLLDTGEYGGLIGLVNAELIARLRAFVESGAGKRSP